MTTSRSPDRCEPLIPTSSSALTSRSPGSSAWSISRRSIEELLKYLLFPLLLGHGLCDEPREPRRIYGAEPADERPARSASSVTPTPLMMRKKADAAVDFRSRLHECPKSSARDGEQLSVTSVG